MDMVDAAANISMGIIARFPWGTVLGVGSGLQFSFGGTEDK